MECDKEGPCAPPCFTVTVVPAEETLEAFLVRSGLHLFASQCSLGRWNVLVTCLPREVMDEYLVGAIEQVCRELSHTAINSRYARSASEVGQYPPFRTGKIIPGDIVAKIMASVK